MLKTDKCEKCGDKNISHLEVNFKGIARIITHVVCRNKECENYNKPLTLHGEPDICPKCKDKNFELGVNENSVWGICHNSECGFFEQK